MFKLKNVIKIGLDPCPKICDKKGKNTSISAIKAVPLGKRLLFNDIQSKRGNQRDGFWLARMNLATHFDRTKSVGFQYFSLAISYEPFGWIFDRKVRREG